MLSPQKAATIEAVESLIQYKFKDSALLWEALNIKPVITPGLPVPPEGNKRLAVIGDSVLQLALAEEWYKGDTSRGGSHTAPFGYHVTHTQSRPLGHEDHF